MDGTKPGDSERNLPVTLGVDSGGTFTDFVWLGANGRLQVFKQLSTPHDPSAAILSGVSRLRVPETATVIHGSTVATNALLERRGARTGLITTAGFSDVLAIGRQNRPDLYALVPQRPEPLVPEEWRYEVNERISAGGEILVELDEGEIRSVAQQIAAEGIESMAICLLFSYLYPDHERRIKESLENAIAKDDSSFAQQVAGMHVSLSSEILPEYREFERTSTTVINAYVAPIMSRYLDQLGDGLAPRKVTVMQSNGGIIDGATAGQQAARTVLSGPAGGVVGARFVAEQCVIGDIISFDMGGTSTDVSLCPGRLPFTSEGEIVGMPLRLPMLDIHTVGAGGGSLAYLDAGGALQVGPQSAGADPGPACYPKQGRAVQSPNRHSPTSTRPWVTVTDANLVLGRLDADHFLGGELILQKEAAFESLTALAGEMSVASAESAAWGVVQVANANMERAVRRISVERGFDPRGFTLVAFGGAGPLHACEMAANLQVPRVLVPTVPGVLSALGMVVAQPTKDYSKTVLRDIGEWDLSNRSWLERQFALLEERALIDMRREGYSDQVVQLVRSLDMRYRGQSYELTVQLSSQSLDVPIVTLFHEAHERRYSFRQPNASVEIVNVRVTALTQSDRTVVARRPLEDSNADEAIVGTKAVWFNGHPLTARLLVREKLRPGNRFRGPALVFQYDTTTVLPVEWQAEVDGYGNLLLSQGHSEDSGLQD